MANRLHIFDNRAKELERKADAIGYPIDESSKWVELSKRATEIQCDIRPNTFEEWANIFELLGGVKVDIYNYEIENARWCK